MDKISREIRRIAKSVQAIAVAPPKLKGITSKSKQRLIDELDIGTAKEKVSNPYSGESVTLEPAAVAIYDYIKGCESLGDYRGMEMGMDIFRANWPKEYMVVLD